MTNKTIRTSALLAPIFVALFLLFSSTASRAKTLPNETPEKFTPTNEGFDYVRREAMIPMRDGVKLHTVILVPKGANRAPILLTRTPYNATALTTRTDSSHLGPSLYRYDNATDEI